MVLTDTFQMTEDDDLVDQIVLPENNARATNQLVHPIRVIEAESAIFGRPEQRK